MQLHASLAPGSLPSPRLRLHLRLSLSCPSRCLLSLSLLFSSSTRVWLETNARRLLKARAALEHQLAKYEPISSRATAPRPTQPLVECHLRAIMKDVATLKNKLASYRPSLADKYAL